MERKKLKRRNVIPLKEKLKSEIILKMTDLGLWKEELLSEIPTYWELYKNFVVFNSKFFADECWDNAGHDLWKCVSDCFSGRSVSIQGKVKNDSFRSPSAKFVYGDSPWVEFFDNGIYYTWNVESTMFCSGNVSERHRVASFDCKDKVVVDMFAGIGYFVLPYLVHAKAEKVIACEWNPVSLRALVENLLKNNVQEKCTILEGDVQVTCPQGVADHVNMGLIPSCEQYWPTAAKILRPSGGIVHVHGNVTTITNFQADEVVKCLKCIKFLKDVCINTSCHSGVESCCDFKMNISSDSKVKVELLHDKQVNWRRLEWFVWVIHTSHSFCEHLFIATNTRWTVTPLFLHRVKSYAPRIDHLVIDLSCNSADS